MEEEDDADHDASERHDHKFTARHQLDKDDDTKEKHFHHWADYLKSFFSKPSPLSLVSFPRGGGSRPHSRSQASSHSHNNNNNNNKETMSTIPEDHPVMSVVVESAGGGSPALHVIPPSPVASVRSSPILFTSSSPSSPPSPPSSTTTEPHVPSAAGRRQHRRSTSFHVLSDVILRPATPPPSLDIIDTSPPLTPTCSPLGGSPLDSRRQPRAFSSSFSPSSSSHLMHLRRSVSLDRRRPSVALSTLSVSASFKTKDDSGWAGPTPPTTTPHRGMGDGHDDNGNVYDDADKANADADDHVVTTTSPSTLLPPLRRRQSVAERRSELHAIARSLLYKGILMHEYGLALRAVLGQPPAMEHLPSFMNHAGADKAILRHFMLPGSLSALTAGGGSGGGGGGGNGGNGQGNRVNEDVHHHHSEYERTPHRRIATRIIALSAWDGYDFALGKYCWAMLLMHGYGCAVDRGRAWHLVGVAARDDEPLAMYELACNAPDPVSVWSWLERAANHPRFPMADACYQLALLYLEKPPPLLMSASSSSSSVMPVMHQQQQHQEHQPQSAEDRRRGSLASIQSASGYRKRDKRKAAKYLRRCIALGKSLPDVYTRWIFKRKYFDGTL